MTTVRDALELVKEVSQLIRFSPKRLIPFPPATFSVSNHLLQKLQYIHKTFDQERIAAISFPVISVLIE